MNEFERALDWLIRDARDRGLPGDEMLIVVARALRHLALAVAEANPEFHSDDLLALALEDSEPGPRVVE